MTVPSIDDLTAAIDRLLEREAELQRQVESLQDNGAKFDAVWRSMMTILGPDVPHRVLLASVAAEIAIGNASVRSVAKRYKLRYSRASRLIKWVKKNLLAMGEKDALDYVDSAGL